MKGKRLFIEKTIIVSLAAFIVIVSVLKVDYLFKGVYAIYQAIEPFITGVVIAIILDIPLKNIEKIVKRKWEKSRVISIVLTYLLFVLILAVCFVIIIPQLYKSLTMLLSNMVTYASTIGQFINNVLSPVGIQLNLSGNESGIDQLAGALMEVFKNEPSIMNFIQMLAPQIFSNISSIASTVTRFIYVLFTSILFSVYILISKEKLKEQFKKVLYAIFDKEISNNIIKVLNKTNEVFTSFVSGTMLEMVILGTLFFIVLSITRMPYALLISLMVGITSMIPYFGAIFSATFGGILVLAEDGLVKMLICLAVSYATQQIENNFIYPNVVGGSVGLPPIWAFACVAVFGSLFGLVGMILALPIGALVYSFVSQYVNEKLTNKDVS